MKISSLAYLCKEGFKNLIHNKLMTLASIGVLSACLLVIGFSTVLGGNLKKIIDFAGEQNVAVLYLKDSTTPEVLNNLTETLKKNENIKDVIYISKDQAIKEFSTFLGVQGVEQFLLSHNVLPASLEVHAKNIVHLEEALTSVDGFDCIEAKTVPSRFANFVRQLEKYLGWVEAVIVVALIVVSLVLISNTIRATVFARRREIAIMKQVGATDNFVRFPFVVEGVVIGILAANVAFLVLGLSYKAFIIILQSLNTESFIKLLFARFVSFRQIGGVIALTFLFGGIFAGVLGSIFSLNKYLKT